MTIHLPGLFDDCPACSAPRHTTGEGALLLEEHVMQEIHHTSTLTGYKPAVGDIVTQQMYVPNYGENLVERITAGRTYKPEYQGMTVVRADALEPKDGITRRWTLEFPKGHPHRNNQWPWSAVEDDWCVLILEQRAPATTEPELNLFTATGVNA